MTPALSGLFWIAIYLGLVLAPLLVLFLGDLPPPGGFWWDLAIALGFAGLTMMGVQSLLTARFKYATAPFGIDIIYYFHRYAAIAGFVIVIAHPVILLIVDPELFFYLNPFDAPWFMTTGVLSVVALTIVMVTSLWRTPLGLSYDAWRVTHSVLAVAAVLLALIHMRGVGFYVSAPSTRQLWTIITLSWLAVVVYVRVLKPWWLRRHPFRVIDVTPERGDAWTVAVEPVGHPGFSFQPGQFAWLTLGHGSFAMREHPFSIASAPDGADGRVEFTIKALGDFTRTIGSVRPGEIAYVDAPYGAFTIERHPAAGYVFLAGGIGIAPIMSMLRSLAARGDDRPHLLVYAYRRWDRLTFRDEVDRLSSTMNLRVVYVLEEPPDDWTGERGRLSADLLARHLPADVRNDRVYFVCGPEPMIRAGERSLKALGVPMRRVHSELFHLV
ncbi:MAG: ferric reductase-like transmembrane domain-containing protein [Acidobacteria bacterium]|nr:ferric reductase-like transmembrane domain-containing protein [Acidobacteriota bacterium]